MNFPDQLDGLFDPVREIPSEKPFGVFVIKDHKGHNGASVVCLSFFAIATGFGNLLSNVDSLFRLNSFEALIKNIRPLDFMWI